MGGDEIANNPAPWCGGQMEDAGARGDALWLDVKARAVLKR